MSCRANLLSSVLASALAASACVALATPAMAQQTPGQASGLRYLTWAGKVERDGGTNGAPQPLPASSPSSAPAYAGAPTPLTDGLRRPNAPIIPRQIANAAGNSPRDLGPRYPGIGAPAWQSPQGAAPASANGLTPASAWLRRGAGTGQPSQPETAQPRLYADAPAPQPLRSPAYAAAARPTMTAPTPITPSAAAPTPSAPMSMSAVPTDGAFTPMPRRQVNVYPAQSGPVGVPPQFQPVYEPQPQPIPQAQGQGQGQPPAQPQTRPSAPSTAAPSPFYEPASATPPGVMSADAANTMAAPAPAPVADPMAPRRDAPIFRMQSSAPPAAALPQTQGQAAPSGGQPYASNAAPTREGARYYSVHRAAGQRPDATAMPISVYLDQAPVDLAEPPPAPTQTRTVDGRVRPIVSNEDPTLP